MKDYNFDSLKNLKAPEEWIENAIKIPQSKKTPVFFIRYSKQIAAAACLVMVFAISMLIYFMYDNEVVNIDLKPNKEQTEQGFTDSTDSSSITGEDSTDPSEYTDETNAQGIVKPTNSKDKNKPAKEPEKEKPTKPNNTDKDDPDSDKPSKPSDNKPPAPPKDPTENTPDDPPHVEPTEDPEPTEEPSAPPQEPTEIWPIEPTESEDPSAPNEGDPGVPSTPPPPSSTFILVSVDIPKSSLSSANERLYCALYDKNGKIVGSDGNFSSHRLCDIQQSADYSNYYTITYYTERYHASYGTYTYFIYNRNGVMLFTGTCYI